MADKSSTTSSITAVHRGSTFIVCCLGSQRFLNPKVNVHSHKTGQQNVCGATVTDTSPSPDTANIEMIIFTNSSQYNF